MQALEDGEVSGLNGVLIGAAAEAAIPGVCLLGEFPYFAQALPNPKASAAILQAFARLSGTPVDVALLEEDARAVEAQLAELQARARAVASRVRAEAEEEEAEADAAAEEAAARARIEVLFDAARQDRARAVELKAELDRLGLFREYEDRFLDLFQRGE